MSLSDRLSQLGPQIREICSAAGNAGLSVGVIAPGDVFCAHYGTQESGKNVTPTDDTVYHIGALSKAITAAGLALLVEEGHMDWTTPITKIVPEFQLQNPVATRYATVMDLLAYRLGIASRPTYATQMEQDILLDPDSETKVLAALPQTTRFRATIDYNDWAYSLAGVIIERSSDCTLQEFMHKHIFGPLNLKRTTFGSFTADDNYATAHITLSDGFIHKVFRPSFGDGTIFAGALGLKSCLHDLLVIYRTMLSAHERQSNRLDMITTGSAFVRLANLFYPWGEDGTTSSGFGWFSTMLPGKIGRAGANHAWFGKRPIIAQGIHGSLNVTYHNSVMPGMVSSVHLIPPSRTAIVVLSNTLGFADVPDYVGGLIIETLLRAPKRTDFISLVTEMRDAYELAYASIKEQLLAEKTYGTKHRPLSQYRGVYMNAQGTFKLVVIPRATGLRVHIQGHGKTYYDLTHYHYDTFLWELDRDAEAKRAMLPQLFVSIRKFHFVPDDGDDIVHIHWVYEPDEPKGEIFHKISPEWLSGVTKDDRETISRLL